MAARPVVSLGDGAVRGRTTAHGDAFLGVPYGEVRRFAPPRATTWHGERDAGRPGPVAPQPRRPIGTFTHGETPEADEQCLSLNVWRPRDAGPGARLPVLVFVHGGGFGVGWGSASLYDGARLAAAERLVVITINYRLGSLGWLHHPDLAEHDGAPSGNWGLLDQRAALRWVAEHVSAFGGDPDNVTLAGQSAGALSAIDHLVAPAPDERLFARAILLSPPMHDAAHAPELGVRWAEALAARAGSLDALRALPAAEVVALGEALLGAPEWAGTRGGALPMLDPATLPAGPDAAALARLDVDVLVGTTADEGAFFFRAAGRRPEPDDAGLRAMVARLPHVTDADAEIAAARAGGGPTDTNSLLVRIATAAMVARPTAAWAARRAAEGGRVHRLRVDHAGPDPDLGAMHSVDVPLLFGTYGDGGPGTRLAGDTPRAAAVSEAFMKACGAFARGEAMTWDADEVRVFGGAPAEAQTVSGN
jgi:para-nitrobenzyl esterase